MDEFEFFDYNKIVEGGINLLEETRQILTKYHHTLEDIKYVQSGSLTAEVNIAILASLFNFKYDNGFGWVKINHKLKLIGKDFWLERYVYDGAECWVYKEFPKIPEQLCSPLAINIMEEE